MFPNKTFIVVDTLKSLVFDFPNFLNCTEEEFFYNYYRKLPKNF